MKKSVAVLVLMSALLLTASEGGWVRKILRKVPDVIKNVAQKKAVTAVSDIVKKYGAPLVQRYIGKRSVNGSPRQAADAGDTLAKALMNELELVCPRLGLNTMQGLSSSILAAAFGESDADKSGNLNDKELDFFENVVDAFKHCVNVLTGKGK